MSGRTGGNDKSVHMKFIRYANLRMEDAGQEFVEYVWNESGGKAVGDFSVALRGKRGSVLIEAKLDNSGNPIYAIFMGENIDKKTVAIIESYKKNKISIDIIDKNDNPTSREMNRFNATFSNYTFNLPAKGRKNLKITCKLPKTAKSKDGTVCFHWDAAKKLAREMNLHKW